MYSFFAMKLKISDLKYLYILLQGDILIIFSLFRDNSKKYSKLLIKAYIKNIIIRSKIISIVILVLKINRLCTHI